MSIDWVKIRGDFPVLKRSVHDKPLIYFDSANTAQKPSSVIDTVDSFYREHNANISRAVHTLGMEATEAFEAARQKIARFINVRADELVLTSGTTQAINLVAYSYALPRLKTGDVILSRKPATWDDFFVALKTANVPTDFLNEKERSQGTQDRDPFEGWSE